MTNYSRGPRPRAVAAELANPMTRSDPAIALTIASVLVALMILELAI
jgi:hypothetical protein